MALIPSYLKWNKLREQEAFEPVFSWGLRMAIAAIVPVIWGTVTGRVEEATWITLAAECICWVELKGSYGQRLRILLGGIILTVVFALLGSVTGGNIWLSLVTMLAVGFFSGLFKNLGDRGSGLAICVYVVFIITNAYPVHDAAALKHRLVLVLIGGGWNAVVGIFAALYTPAKEPYRRTVAIIWKNISALTGAVAQGWDGSKVRSSLRDIYLKEKEVRTAIDTSLALYNTMAHQVTSKDGHEYQLAQVRKATSLVAAHIIAIAEELEGLNIQDADNNLKLKLYGLLKAMDKLADRMAVFMVILNPEEELLVNSRINRLSSFTGLLKEYIKDSNSPHTEPIKRIVLLSERVVKLANTTVDKLREMEKDTTVFRSYSLIKTVYILHPSHWVRNLKLLFDLNTFTARYALRAAIAGTIGLFISKYFALEHGYWLPFTVIIVLQPYFGATLQKALDRVLGTVAGGVAGGLFLILPVRIYLTEIMLFICYLMMVYFLRKRYSVAVFFITLSLVLLFDVEDSLDPGLILERALATVGGAALAIISGFALLPHWDKKWLPNHLTKAINSNYEYFISTFFSDTPVTNWTRFKRNAETKNSNAFDSFSRFMQEPGTRRKKYALYYHLITHNVRLTRELNNIHLEQEEEASSQENILPAQQEKLATLLQWFNKNMLLVKQIDSTDDITLAVDDAMPKYQSKLSALQALYLDRMLIELKAMHNDLQKLAHHETE